MAGLYDNFLDRLSVPPTWNSANEQAIIFRVPVLHFLADHASQNLLDPYSYLLTTPGKEIRSAMIDAFNVWLKVPESNLDIVKSLVKRLHTASLLSVLVVISAS
jgi:geranylgeranyl diphosphate synthase type 3